MPEYTLRVLPEDVGKRLDLYVADFSKTHNLGLSRSSIQRLILKGSIRVKNLKSVKTHYKLKCQDEIKILIEEKKSEHPKAENIPLEIIYQDDDLAIINKPCGLVVHPAPGNPEHTLVNALLFHFKKLSDVNPQRPGIVHRLDKDTSGLLVIAKNNVSHLALASQFAKHTVKRKYIALVKGKMEFDQNFIELPITRHTLKRKQMTVGFGQKAKSAKTFYHTLKRLKDTSLVELEPFTGRTHQLRVHLAFLSHPILGDTKYGKNNQFGRLALHASSLGFTHPATGRFVEFSSDLPIEFKEFMNKEIAEKS